MPVEPGQRHWPHDFTITDDNGNETFFRDGILTYTKDAYGNGIYYCYNGINFDTPDGKSWRPNKRGL